MDTPSKISDFKLVLDDARARQVALLQLIYFTDQQATALLRLYVPIGLAAGTGAIASKPQLTLPLTPDTALSLALVVSALVLFVGCLFCYQAMSIKSRELSLPGRGADFWKFVIENDYTTSEAVQEYLTDLAEGQIDDKDFNTTTARALKRAKLAGIAAPLVALLFYVGALVAAH